MKHFLTDTLITLVISIGLVAIAMLSICPRMASRADNEHMDMKRYMDAHIDDISVLIVGHSHSETGIDPAVFDSAYNFATMARISYYDAALAEHYVPLMSNLRAMVFPLMCEYEPGTALNSPSWGERSILNYSYIYGIPPAPELKSRITTRQHIYETLSQVFSIQPLKRTITYDSLGFPSRGDEVGNENNVHVAPDCEPLVKASLIRMARVCRDHGVRLIVVTMPCNSTYRADHTDCDSRLQQLMDDIATDYPAVEYRCYLNDERFGDSLFSDQTHMNQRGATAFSLQLKEDFGL